MSPNIAVEAPTLTPSEAKLENNMPPTLYEQINFAIKDCDCMITLRWSKGKRIWRNQELTRDRSPPRAMRVNWKSGAQSQSAGTEASRISTLDTDTSCNKGTIKLLAKYVFHVRNYLLTEVKESIALGSDQARVADTFISNWSGINSDLNKRDHEYKLFCGQEWAHHTMHSFLESFLPRWLSELIV